MKKVKKKKSTPRRRRDSTSPQASSDSMQQPSSDSAQQPGSKATQIQSCLESTPRQQPCPRSTPQQPIPRALPLSETYYSSRSLLPSKADPSTTPPLRKTDRQMSTQPLTLCGVERLSRGSCPHLLG
uniref:Uncharacterized protein n=1 Tax=Castor canadensis TaxID=51338 RepID=A0A8C0WGY0_CASCN